MKIYYNSANNSIVIGNSYYSPATCRLSFSIDEAEVTVFSNIDNSQFVEKSKIISLQKENGDFYTDKADLLTSLGLDFFSYSSSTSGSSEVKLLSSDGGFIDTQTPLQVSGDSIYETDIDFDNSDFTGWTGDPANLFKSPFSDGIENATANNPKTIILAFKRTVGSLQLGLGCNSGDFSNTKITLIGSGGAERSIYDKSTDNTKQTSLNAKFDNELFNSIKIEFYTDDAVCLSNITIQKAKFNVTQIQGVKPNGDYNSVNLSGFGNLNVAIKEIVSDAFGRTKVSLPTSLLDSIIEHDMNNTFVDYLTNGTGAVAFDNTNKLVNMNVTTADDYAVIETIANGKYQPGKALEFVASTLLATETGIIKRCGYCTVRGIGITATNQIVNGVYLENKEGVISWNIVKNSIVTESVTQANWNVDILDGSGASYFNLDMASVQLPYIDLQFLAVGTVRVGFNINGKDIIVHEFYHANNNFTSTYMQTANLPVHYSITSTIGAGSMKAIGYSVASGGGFDALGKMSFVDVEDIAIGSGDEELLVGIRLKEEYYNSFVKLLSAEVMTTGSSNFQWMLLLDPTYTGTVTWVDTANSSIQYARNNANDVTDRGCQIVSGLASDRTRSSDSQIDNSLRLAKKLDGSFIEIWLVAKAFTGDDFHGVINFKDLF
jgi:hypothetical protein